MALRRAQDPAAGRAAADRLRLALLAAGEATPGEPVDGMLLGMAAAQLARLGLREGVQCLCAFAATRLSQCGGREVAELASAAAKLGVEDPWFFFAVGAFCADSSHSFRCLRDVALVSTALLRRLPGQADSAKAVAPGTPRLDGALAFRGLATAAAALLAGTGKVVIRDIAEFLYSFASACPLEPLAGGQRLAMQPVVARAFTAAATAAAPLLHCATAQDIAKLSGSIAVTWSLLPQLQPTVLQPFATQLAQALRFRAGDFNVQDLSLTANAFAKIGRLEDVAADVLSEQISQKLSYFTDKDLSLLLSACARPGWAADRLTQPALTELAERDLSDWQVHDLCMTAQALVKIGGTAARPQMCLISVEAFNRQLQGFSSSDKAILLWALAKSKVIHLGLCCALVRALAIEEPGALAREVVSAALWALAVVWPSLPVGDVWPAALLRRLCLAEPWREAPAYEVANAAWAFSQLPGNFVDEHWPALIVAVADQGLTATSLHELCNLLSGLVAACQAQVPRGPELLAHVAAEVQQRVSKEAREQLSGHDRRSLRATLEHAQAGGSGWCSELAALKAAVFDAAESSVAPPPPVRPASAASAAGSPELRASRRVSRRGLAVNGAAAGQATEEEVDEEQGRGHSAACSAVLQQDVVTQRCLDMPHLGRSWIEFSHHGGHGHAHGHGDAHGDCGAVAHGEFLAQEFCDEASATYASACSFDQDDDARQHGQHGKPSCNLTCCPQVFEKGAGAQDSLLRLNAHCTYSGHCVQMKHTFIHVECTQTHSDSEDDCVLCRLARPRALSCDIGERPDLLSSPVMKPSGSPWTSQGRSPRGECASPSTPHGRSPRGEDDLGRAHGGESPSFYWQ